MRSPVKGFVTNGSSRFKDFANHVLGGAFMGVGGVVAMGCTIGQAVTGVSTLSMGSILAFFAIVIGAVATMSIV